MDFKDRLELAMQRSGITAAELSRVSGIREGAISSYRKGLYKATQSNLERLAEALHVSIPWLMGVVPDEEDTIEINKEPDISMDDELLDAKLIRSLTKLTPSELEKVDSFVQGLLAARGGAAFPRGLI